MASVPCAIRCYRPPSRLPSAPCCSSGRRRRFGKTSSARLEPIGQIPLLFVLFALFVLGEARVRAGSPLVCPKSQKRGAKTIQKPTQRNHFAESTKPSRNR